MPRLFATILVRLGLRRLRHAAGLELGGAWAPNTAQLSVHEEHIIKAEIPSDSHFKGYKDYVVPNLILRPHVFRFQR